MWIERCATHQNENARHFDTILRRRMACMSEEIMSVGSLSSSAADVNKCRGGPREFPLDISSDLATIEGGHVKLK